MQGDAIEPGAQAGVAVEAANAAEDLDEDFLGDVGGVGRVVEAARDQRIERLMILRDENGERVLGAGLEVGYKSSIFGGDANCAREMAHYHARLHIGCPLQYDFCETSWQIPSCGFRGEETAPAPAECSLTLLSLDTGT